MNRGQLVTRVARKMGFDTTTGSEDRLLLEDLANAAVVEVLEETHCYLDIGDMTLISGTAEYRLDANILAIDDGRGSTPAGVGNYEVIPLQEMIRVQSAAPVSTGWKKMISFDGDLMVVSPTPSTGETLRFYYVPKPTAMTDDSHDPSTSTYGGIPSQYHRALEYYMLWQSAEDSEKRSPMTPKDYFQIFQGECTLIRQRKQHMKGRRLGPAQIGYPGARRFPLRNDTYPSQTR